MNHLTSFATPEFPLHPSGMRQVLECPWRKAMEHMFYGPDGEGDSGAPADTGSAMHAAAAAFHRGSSQSESLASMQERSAEYPKGDLTDAAGLFLAYANDPRCARVTPAAYPDGGVFIEREITFSIAPHPTDPTGAPIAVLGTVDQVVVDDVGRLYVRDIKTTRHKPADKIAEYELQIAAYCVGVAMKLGKPVHAAQLIFPRHKCFVHQYEWSFDDVEHILEGVRLGVARIRAGELYHVRNSNCQWCPMKTPAMCMPALKEHKRKALTVL